MKVAQLRQKVYLKYTRDTNGCFVYFGQWGMLGGRGVLVVVVTLATIPPPWCTILTSHQHQCWAHSGHQLWALLSSRLLLPIFHISHDSYQLSGKLWANTSPFYSFWWLELRVGQRNVILSGDDSSLSWQSDIGTIIGQY